MKTLIVRPLLLLGLLLSPMAWADSPARADRPDGAAIASGHALATQAGIDILAQGGNAFDAAVAVSSTLAVVEPISSGLGGGGFFLLHDAASNRDVLVDAREVAPASANAAMYLDANGELDTDKAENGPTSVRRSVAQCPPSAIASDRTYVPELTRASSVTLSPPRNTPSVTSSSSRLAGSL